MRERSTAAVVCVRSDIATSTAAFTIEEATTDGTQAAIRSGQTTCQAIDPREPLTALPNALISDRPYASFAVIDGTLASQPKPLTGLRIAILREHMVKRTPNHEAIAHQVDREIKTVLRDELGAELVETNTAAYPDDPDVPNVKYTFSDALSELLPRLMPEIFTRRNDKGQLLFAVPGYDVTSYDYLRKPSTRKAPLTDKITIINFETYASEPCYIVRCNDVAFDIDRYLAARNDATIKTFADWVLMPGSEMMRRELEPRTGRAERWAASPP